MGIVKKTLVCVGNFRNEGRQQLFSINGHVEIYVSDVVRVSYYGKTKPFEDGKVLEVSGSNVGVVIETDMGFDVEFEDKTGRKTLLSTLLSTVDVEEKEFEVLGDIYDPNFSRPRKKWII